MGTKQSMRLRCRLLFVVVGLTALTGSTAWGTLITWDANTVFSGTAPAGTPGWLTAQFDDHGSSGSVTLTMTAANLEGTENVASWLFNVDPAINPATLTFSAPTLVSGSFDTSDFTVSKGTDGFKADGDGYYDIEIDFPSHDGNVDRFTGGDSVSFTITGSSITANSFNFTSSSGGGNGTYTMAAHVQNTPNGGGSSCWVAPVPEPSTLLLLGIACVGLIVRVWRRS